jgi:uncharacterized protein YjeT (DUF2065 family)
MRDFGTAVGLVLVLEGVLYAAFPAWLKRMMAAAQAVPEGSLRTAGLLALGTGVTLIWILRGGS